MRSLLQELVQDYGWAHLGIGLIGNCLFLIGSILFLPDWAATQISLGAVEIEWKTLGVWFFIAGAALMLLGQLLVSIYSDRKQRRRKEARGSA